MEPPLSFSGSFPLHPTVSSSSHNNDAAGIGHLSVRFPLLLPTPVRPSLARQGTRTTSPAGSPPSPTSRRSSTQTLSTPSGTGSSPTSSSPPTLTETSASRTSPPAPSRPSSSCHSAWRLEICSRWRSPGWWTRSAWRWSGGTCRSSSRSRGRPWQWTGRTSTLHSYTRWARQKKNKSYFFFNSPVCTGRNNIGGRGGRAGRCVKVKTALSIRYVFIFGFSPIRFS